MERFALLSYIKRISGWRYGSWPVGIILIAAAVLTILYFAVAAPFWDKKKSEISAQLSERLHARIHFTGLSIGIFNGDIHVKGVSIESGALVLEVKDLVLRLALGEFIKTRNLQKSLREIALDEPVVSFRKP
ncbi:MAG: hypothetical protein JNM63_19520, partial [Spirochaetia bacterium]|nr:hypothetical protein [Spirochaetia bacterium]